MPPNCGNAQARFAADQTAAGSPWIEADTTRWDWLSFKGLYRDEKRVAVTVNMPRLTIDHDQPFEKEGPVL